MIYKIEGVFYYDWHPVLHQMVTSTLTRNSFKNTTSLMTRLLRISYAQIQT